MNIGKRICLETSKGLTSRTDLQSRASFGPSKLSSERKLMGARSYGLLLASILSALIIYAHSLLDTKIFV
jgi:hypothetical protein